MLKFHQRNAVVFLWGGVGPATGELTAIDLAAMERALRAVEAKHKDSPLMLTGEPNYASYLNAPARVRSDSGTFRIGVYGDHSA